MATYAIGDVQGCYDTLAALLERVGFDPSADEVWLAGDLVNRGPKNVQVLRWCVDHAPRVRAVLGNHDLHVLAAAEGLREPRGRDTMQDVLRSEDREVLLDFLARQPFLHEDEGHVMVHAGWPPRWSLEQLRARAGALSAWMAGPNRRELLEALAGAVDPAPEAVADVAALTRMRTVDADGEPVYGFDGAPEEAPAGQLPWFDWPRRPPPEKAVICGHWAALGLLVRPDLVALDTGCVWGNTLTAVRLEDRQVFSVPAQEPRGSRG